MPKNALSRTDRAVYDLVARGGIGAAHAALYRRELAALGRAGLVTRREDGAYVPSDPRAPSVPPVPSASAAEATLTAPPPEPMATLVVRVPQSVISALDAEIPDGGTRSDAARAALGRGLRRRSGTQTRAS